MLNYEIKFTMTFIMTNNFFFVLTRSKLVGFYEDVSHSEMIVIKPQSGIIFE